MFFFVCKQKTAYELRISDWSSDVCSSDLFDPKGTGKHGYPWGEGHLGDLPALYVDAEGSASHPVLAPRLTSLDQVVGHALMVHKGGDNHADHPKPSGGGGAREACGVIKQ